MNLAFSTDDYVVPEWSAMPKYSYHLEIIKDGNIVGNIDIKKKQFILIGRNAQLCDLFIDNPSVSRKHAILQFKRNEDLPYLYDLGGTHGTEVNRKKLPVRAFQKLKPFDTIKFGLSSRFYVLRCPQIELQQKINEDENDNKFEQILSQRKRQLSKQQMKQRYLQLLENDPYFKANNLSRKLKGADSSERKVNGVDWGISDQYEVYSYRNESQYQLQADIIRRLPGLDQNQLNKISEYEGNLRKYEQIQSQLNQLANKQKKQYGLEQKLREKKQRLEKRFVEAVEALQKSEDWIRVHLFGDKQAKVLKKQKAQKQSDTFEDDQFYDRTLVAKRQRKQQQQNNKLKGNSIFTTDDFWKLQKQLRGQLKKLIHYEKQLRNQFQNQQVENQIQQEDDLDAYMKENNQNLSKQQNILNNERSSQSRKKVDDIKNYLVSLIGYAEVKKIEDEQRGIFNKLNQTQEERKSRRDADNRKKISDVLDRLDIIKEAEQEVDEEDIKIFGLYKDRAQQQEQEDSYKRVRQEDNGEVQSSYSEGIRKRGGQSWGREAYQDKQQEYEDLTKLK